MKMEYRDDPDLMEVLENADDADLTPLVEVITDGGEGRLSLDNSQCDTLWAARQAESYPPQVRTLLAACIQGFGGNSVSNILRFGQGVVYREVLTDVADHFKVSYSKGQDLGTIEQAVLAKALEQSLGAMTEADREKVFAEFGVPYKGMAASKAALFAAIALGGVQAFKLSSLIVPPALRYLSGRAISVSLVPRVAALAGPIGITLAGIWTVYDLASPAYRITVPCVLQIAHLRQKQLVRQCPACQSLQSTSAKFCSDCGHKLGAA